MSATATIPAEQFEKVMQRDFPLPVADTFAFEREARTDYVSWEDVREEAGKSLVQRRMYHVNAAALMLIVGSCGNASSIIIDTDSTDPLNFNRLQRDYPVADFHAPVNFTWTKSAHRIRQAAKHFSEQIHADY